MVGSVRFKIFVLTVSSLLLSGSLYGVPYELSDGGRLVETNGKPVDGPIDIGVKFYSSATGSEPVAGVTVPNFTSVTLNEGVFQLVISLTATEFHIIFNETDAAWIEIKDVTHNITYPRQKFSVVPYALKVPVDGESITYNVDGKLTLGRPERLSLKALNTDFAVSLKSPDNQGANQTFTLPGGVGMAGQFLKSDGAGNMLWDNLPGGGDMLRTNNLSDVANVATARTNLALGDAATKNVGTAPGTVAAGDHGHTATNISGFDTAVAAAPAVTANTAKVSYPSGDATKVGYLTVTAATNLDQMRSDVTANNAKTAYPAGDATKVGYLTVTAATNLDTLRSAVAGLGSLASKNTVAAGDIDNGSISLTKLSSTLCAANQILRMNATGDAISCVDLSAATAPSIVTKSANYALQESDNGSTLIQTTAGTTMTLPLAATSGSGFAVTIKNAAADFIRIVTQNGELLDGTAAGVVVNSQGSAILTTDGAKWFFLNAHDAGISRYKYYRIIFSSARNSESIYIGDLMPTMLDGAIANGPKNVTFTNGTGTLSAISDFNPETAATASTLYFASSAPYDATATVAVTFEFATPLILAGSIVFVGDSDCTGCGAPDAWYWEASHDSTTWVPIAGSGATASSAKTYVTQSWNIGF